MQELKFAVVREDPLIEEQLVRHANARNILLVGSGGCTALHLGHTLPEVEVVAYDFNPQQLAHIEQKNEAVARGDLAALNIEDADPQGLNQCGAFEGLFRILRLAMEEWVAPPTEIRAFFDEPDAVKRQKIASQWVQARYWPSVFASVFHDPLLNAMFGPAATQHATPGSYPAYFQGVFAKGLLRNDAASNPFLQHILLGYYKAQDAPAYTRASKRQHLTLCQGSLPEIHDIERFAIVHLSNIFDWSDDSLVTAWAEHLKALAPGAYLITRQLNNTRSLRSFLAETFAHQEALGAAWQASDRSLFYNQIDVWQRRG